MSGLSLDVLRVGKRYRVINFGDHHDVEVEEVLGDREYQVKDLHTLEHFLLSDIIRFGTGNDYEIRDLGEA